MTDREILEWYHKQPISILEGTGERVFPIDQALTQLRTYYREKIKKLGIERIYQIIRVSHVNKWGLHPTKKYSEDLANAILKEIDKEINNGR